MGDDPLSTIGLDSLERLTQTGNVGVHRSRHATWRILAPHRLDQLLNRNNSICLQDQRDHQGELSSTGQPYWPVRPVHLNRSEDLKLHPNP